jgi:secondary thiamine-phosphate synthase enzyme
VTIACCLLFWSPCCLHFICGQSPGGRSPCRSKQSTLIFGFRKDCHNPLVGCSYAVIKTMIHTLTIRTTGQGLYEFTEEVTGVVRQSKLQHGLCTLFVQHTSASLIIHENADPAVRRDLEQWLNRLIRENDPLYTHTVEGPDDMPAHIKSALTSTSLSVPIVGGHLALGTWQGIYLWEHRHHSGHRQVLVHLAE